MAAPRYISQLLNKRVIVIGGTSGIGLAVAEGLVEEGARVHVASSRQAKVKEAISRLSDPNKVHQPSGAAPASERITGATLDLGDGPKTEANLQAFFESLPASWQGKVDHIVYTATDPLAIKPLADIVYEDIINAGQLRFTSVVLLAKLALKYVEKNGSITVTSGSVALRPRPDWAVVNGYCTALEGLVRGLALDLSRLDDRRIRVNLVMPGAVETPLWDGLPQETRQTLFKQMEEKSLTKKVPLPDTVAHTYLGILKDHNATGQVFVTDSGASLV